MGRLAELWCGWRRRHDFEMHKATVWSADGKEVSDWEADNSFILVCRNCGAVYVGSIDELEGVNAD